MTNLQSRVEALEAIESEALRVQGRLADALSAALSVPRDERHNRNFLGRKVREVWIAWARKQPNAKLSWLVPYDDLDECDKQVDREIGEALADLGVQGWLATNRFLFQDIRAALANPTISETPEVADKTTSAMIQDVYLRTVEQCAQIADEHHKELVGKGPCGRGSVNTARIIADEIRARPRLASAPASIEGK